MKAYTPWPMVGVLMMALCMALPITVLRAEDDAPAETASAGEAPAENAPADDAPADKVYCGNLTYGGDKTSVCFSSDFLKEVDKQTHIRAHGELVSVRLDSQDLFLHPFVVMTGEGEFTLTEAEQKNLRNYLLNGGFLVASAGCSSDTWKQSFTREIAKVFPEMSLKKLPAAHPVFHTVHDVTHTRYKSGAAGLPDLKALEVDGRVVLIFSPDGLNDTASVGGNCCCCGGNEVKQAKLININLLAYALTH